MQERRNAEMGTWKRENAETQERGNAETQESENTRSMNTMQEHTNSRTQERIFLIDHIIPWFTHL